MGGWVGSRRWVERRKKKKRRRRRRKRKKETYLLLEEYLLLLLRGVGQPPTHPFSSSSLLESPTIREGTRP